MLYNVIYIYIYYVYIFVYIEMKIRDEITLYRTSFTRELNTI